MSSAFASRCAPRSTTSFARGAATVQSGGVRAQGDCQGSRVQTVKGSGTATVKVQSSGFGVQDSGFRAEANPALHERCCDTRERYMLNAKSSFHIPEPKNQILDPHQHLKSAGCACTLLPKPRTISPKTSPCLFVTIQRQETQIQEQPTTEPCLGVGCARFSWVHTSPDISEVCRAQSVSPYPTNPLKLDRKPKPFLHLNPTTSTCPPSINPQPTN